MRILGTKSKRDIDKLALTKLHPDFLEDGITFKEAKCTLVCNKIYWQYLDIKQMPKEVIDKYYLKEEPHRMFVGEVVKVIGEF